jgi:hypothetical protein
MDALVCSAIADRACELKSLCLGLTMITNASEGSNDWVAAAPLHSRHLLPVAPSTPVLPTTSPPPLTVPLRTPHAVPTELELPSPNAMRNLQSALESLWPPWIDPWMASFVIQLPIVGQVQAATLAVVAVWAFSCGSCLLLARMALIEKPRGRKPSRRVRSPPGRQASSRVGRLRSSGPSADDLLQGPYASIAVQPELD